MGFPNYDTSVPFNIVRGPKLGQVPCAENVDIAYTIIWGYNENAEL